MPVEHLAVWLKPANFFAWNPAMDLPQMKDTVSRKVIADGTETYGNASNAQPVS